MIHFDAKGNEIGQSHRRNPVKRYDAAGRLIAPPKPQAAAVDPDAVDLGTETMMLLEPRAASPVAVPANPGRAVGVPLGCARAPRRPRSRTTRETHGATRR